MSFKNGGAEKSITVKITITTTDADSEEDTLELDGVSITRSCGDGSTTIGKSSPAAVSQASNVGTALSSTGTFTNSNPNCALKTPTVSPADKFEIAGTADSYTVTLKASQTTTLGTYSYTVSVAAQGGASQTATG